MATKRIFYITSSGLTVLYCDKGQVHELGQFDATPEGAEAFGHHVQLQPDLPSAVLMDVVEEEFRTETLPHVIGSDRSKLLARKMAALFRTTPFRTATVTGRERSGKRRDQVLFSGLTKPEWIEPWLNEMRTHKVPLVGIYSLPILTQSLMKRLNIKHVNTLVLSIQQGNLLRQSFINNGELKISRLSPMLETDIDSCLALVLHEVDRNQHYLARLQLLTFSKPIEVVLISEGEQLEKLRQGCIDSQQFHFNFIDINDAAKKVGLKASLTADQSERCFAYLLSRSLPASNYVPNSERLYYSLFKARKAMVAVSVVLAMVATAWSINNIFDGQQYKLRAAQVDVDTQRVSGELDRAVKKLPLLPYEPLLMQATVDSVQQLSLNKPKVLDALLAVSIVLAKHNNIRLDEIQWGTEQGDDNEMIAEEFAESNRVQEVALIKAHLIQFPKNYQMAFKQVEAFVLGLKSDSRIQNALAVALPLDVDPKRLLVGETQRFGDIPEAKFEIKVWLKNDKHDV